MQWNEKVAMPSGMCNRTIQISQLKGKNQNIHTIYSLYSKRSSLHGGFEADPILRFKDLFFTFYFYFFLQVKVISWKLSHRRLQFSRRLLCDSDRALFILAEQLLPFGSRYTVPPSRQLYKQRKTQQWPSDRSIGSSISNSRIVPLCTLVVRRVNTCMSPALLTATREMCLCLSLAQRSMQRHSTWVKHAHKHQCSKIVGLLWQWWLKNVIILYRMHICWLLWVTYLEKQEQVR